MMPAVSAAHPVRDLFAARRFLIVEDFDGMRNILRDLLRRCGGKQIDVVANGAEAMLALGRGKYDVVLCDYYLGAGRNGQQILEEARHQGLIGPAAIFIMVTAEKTPDMVMGAVEFQPDEYLIKPITEAMLQTRLLRLIGRKTAYAAIETAMRARDYGKAIALCDERMAQDKASITELTRLKGEVYLLLGQYDAARQTYAQQMAAREVSWARTGLAKVAFHQGDLKQARKLLIEVIRDNRSYVEAYDWLARVQGKLGEDQEAQQVLLRCVEVSPRSAARQRSLGDLSLKCADLDLAEQAYRKSIGLAAHSALRTPDAHLGLARVHGERGQHDEALKVLGQIPRQFEGEGARLQALAGEVHVHRARGDTERADKLVEEIAARAQSGEEAFAPEVTLSLAAALMATEHRDAASDLLQFVARNHHEDPAVLHRAREIYTDAGMEEEGGQLLDASRRQAIEAMDQGVRLAAQGKLDEALEAMRAARTLLPNNPRLLLNHAFLLIAALERRGWQHALYTEARKCIDTARHYAYDEARAVQMLARLDKLVRLRPATAGDNSNTGAG